MTKKSRMSGIGQYFSPGTENFKKFYISVTAFSLLLMMVSGAVGASWDGSRNDDKEDGREVDVDNFGKVTDFFYRGAQPKGDDYRELSLMGIKTIVDLRNDPKDYARELTERARMKYINLPMSDKSYPAGDAATKFLDIVTDRDNWPVFVHCAGGRHRTGAMAAVFRMSMQGWDIERAYEEMKDYDFYTRWGHKAMKQYVYDYYEELLNRRGRNSSVSTKTR